MVGRCARFFWPIALLAGGCATVPRETVVVVVPESLARPNGQTQAMAYVLPTQVLASANSTTATKARKALLSAPASRPPTFLPGSIKEEGVELASRHAAPQSVSQFWTAVHLDAKPASPAKSVPDVLPAALVISYLPPQPINRPPDSMTERPVALGVPHRLDPRNLESATIIRASFTTGE